MMRDTSHLLTTYSHCPMWIFTAGGAFTLQEAWFSVLSFVKPQSNRHTELLTGNLKIKINPDYWKISPLSKHHLHSSKNTRAEKLFCPEWPTEQHNIRDYLTNRFHVAVRLFSNRSQMTLKCSKPRAAGECVTDAFNKFWPPLWSITEQTHGNMESIRLQTGILCRLKTKRFLSQIIYVPSQLTGKSSIIYRLFLS